MLQLPDQQNLERVIVMRTCSQIVPRPLHENTAEDRMIIPEIGPAAHFSGHYPPVVAVRGTLFLPRTRCCR